MDVIELCDGRLVKVLFRDGEKIRSIRGELKPTSSNFLRVQTLTQEFLLNISDVIKIQIPNESANEGDCHAKKE